jgi:hypothetical protein
MAIEEYVPIKMPITRAKEKGATLRPQKEQSKYSQNANPPSRWFGLCLINAAVDHVRQLFPPHQLQVLADPVKHHDGVVIE